MRHSLIIIAILAIFCWQTPSAFGLDSSPITIVAKDKDVETTKKVLLEVMHAKGYKIDKSSDGVLEFRRALKGILGFLSASEKLQQEDVVNCLLSSESGSTLISCRTFLESVNRKGIEKRTEKTQAIGYRKKLKKELDGVNK